MAIKAAVDFFLSCQGDGVTTVFTIPLTGPLVFFVSGMPSSFLSPSINLTSTPVTGVVNVSSSALGTISASFAAGSITFTFGTAPVNGALVRISGTLIF